MFRAVVVLLILLGSITALVYVVTHAFRGAAQPETPPQAETSAPEQGAALIEEHPQPATASVAEQMTAFFAQRNGPDGDPNITDEQLRQELAQRHKKERFLALFRPDALPVGGSFHISQRYGGKHPAIDFAAAQGADVLAIASGVVRYQMLDPYLGNVMVVDHLNGYASLYAHLHQGYFAPGQFVEKGQAIASVGNTGHSTGPHLHLELWLDGQRVDPALLLPIPEQKTSEE